MSSNKYQSPIERSNAYMVKVEDLVREIVIQNNIPYYRIESRMDHNPNTTDGITYLPVVRIITYFEDSVDTISKVLQTEFDVEMEQPADKQKMKVDSFASKHIEYKVTLKANRLALTEYKRYGTKQFEIQVCSMLQDAWNGIERELGYDGGTIPDEARRDFYRVGALLEMADIEFLKIRSLINNKQEENVAATKPETAPVSKPEPAPVAQPIAAAPQPMTTPVQEQPQPVTNFFTSQPITYQAEPRPEPVMQQPKVAAQQMNNPISGIAPQRAMPVNNNIAGIAPKRVSAMDTNVNSSQPAATNITNTQQQIPAQEKVAAAVNIASAIEQVAPAFVPQQPVNTPPQPVYSQPAPPVAEKQPDPIQFSNNNDAFMDSIAGKVNEVTHEQPQQQATQYFFEEKPKSTAPQPLDENAQMSDASLKEYVLNSKLLREIDSAISARAGAKLNDEIDIEGDVERLRFLKVFSLKQLHEKLTDNKNDIIAFAEKWIGKDNGGSFDMGICLFYLEYLLVGKKNDPGFAVEYVLKFISDNDYSARYIIPTYNSIRQGDSSASKFSHLTLK